MTCLWKDIAAAFGSSSSSLIQKEICNDGFSIFDMKQPVMYYPKLPFMARHNYQYAHWSANFSFEEED